MRARLAWALCCLACGLGLESASAATDAEPAPLLDVRGNLVLVDEIYHAVAALPREARADHATAERLRERLLTFLHTSGYILATVEAAPEGERIIVRVDEGRLAKIVVRGASPVTALALRLQLDLPHDVFNFPQLERRLRELTRDLGGRFAYELVPNTGSGAPVRFDPSRFIPGQAPLASGSAYELHIDVAGEGGAHTGWRIEAAIDPDSFRAGAGYTGVGALFDGDRWDVDAQVGLNFFDDLRRDATDLRFSRSLARVRWFTPALGFADLRPTLTLTEDLVRRQRQDLAIEGYMWNRLRGTAGLSVEVASRSALAIGIGVEQRDLFATTVVPLAEIRSPGGVTPVAPPAIHERRPFAEASLELRFAPEEPRADRQHELDAAARYFLDDDGGGGGFVLVELDYEKVWSFGWDDLWLSGAAGLADGDFTLADTIPMTGRYLRGVFGDDYYMDRAASVALEYRLSLTRDVFKVGVFHELAAWRETLDAGVRPPLRCGDSFGPSFHALVMDVVQLDVYYAFGFSSDRRHDNGVVLRLRKAF